LDFYQTFLAFAVPTIPEECPDESILDMTVIGDRHLAKSLKLMHFSPTPNVMQWKLIQKQ
jgi:hypothetical protein